MDLTPLGQYGAVGLLLAVFIFLHFRSLKSGEKREETMAAQLVANRQECREDTGRLVARIQTLEDQHSANQSRLVETCVDTLRTNAQAFAKLAETDRLPAIKGDR